MGLAAPAPASAPEAKAADDRAEPSKEAANPGEPEPEPEREGAIELKSWEPDTPYLRALGHRLEQIGELQLAARTFEEVLRLRTEEPQSFRDLALVLARLKQFERAMQLLAHVVMNRWDRFDEIEVIASSAR